MTINQRTKGHNGEREFVNLMNKNLNLTGKNAAVRNVDQVRKGGGDIMSVKPFAVEIKRGQVLQLDKWWQQAVRQCTKKNPIPVLAFRQDRKKWRVCFPADILVKKRLVKKGERVEVNLAFFWHIAKKLI